MSSLSLWFKWAWRDLRQRWLQVVAVAMVIALGTGAYSGLGSNAPWRTRSYDESYAGLNMYDLKMELSPGSYLDAAGLAQVVDAVAGIREREMRLILPTFVDASTPQRTIVVPGRIVGVDVLAGGPAINGIHISAGRTLEADDSGELACILEHNFASYYGLQPGSQEIRVRGGLVLEPVGTGMSPEYFVVTTEEGGMMAQAEFAVLFVPLATAQEIAGLPGQVNDLLITTADGADVEAVAEALQEAVAAAFPQVGVTFELKAENEVYSLLYEDISVDQGMFNVFAFLLLAGAALGTFTLVSRMVESQRREIGIHMALGVEPGVIAARYLLAGVQIALLGVLLGIVVGAVFGQALGNLLREMFPMPYLETPFQTSVFLRGALLGIAIPLLAAVYPIWRAIRVTPIEAIQTGPLVVKGGGLAPLLARFRLPGSSIAKFPFRNLLRNPRRTLLTILGITMAIILLVATIGMLDTFEATLDAGRQEHLKDASDKMFVVMDSFYPAALLPTSPKIAQAEPLVVLSGKMRGQKWDAGEREAFDVIIQLLDMDNDLWTPTLLRGDRGAGPGVIIAEKAARDLEVDVGDTVILEHPYRESQLAYRLQESEVRVVGIHADVLRFYLYMDIEDAALMNLAGWANSLQIRPAAGVDEETIRQELSRMPGVASVRSVSALVDTYAELLDLFVGMLAIVRYVALLLAFLIAFNTTSINVDERRRELATMFAFGMRVRTAVVMSVTENLVTGMLSTVIGAGLGWVVLQRILSVRMETTLPEIGILIRVAPSTLVLVACFGVLVVSLTPILTLRKISRMNISATLRVVE